MAAGLLQKTPANRIAFQASQPALVFLARLQLGQREVFQVPAYSPPRHPEDLRGWFWLPESDLRSALAATVVPDVSFREARLQDDALQRRAFKSEIPAERPAFSDDTYCTARLSVIGVQPTSASR